MIEVYTEYEIHSECKQYATCRNLYANLWAVRLHSYKLECLEDGFY